MGFFSITGASDKNKKLSSNRSVQIARLYTRHSNSLAGTIDKLPSGGFSVSVLGNRMVITDVAELATKVQSFGVVVSSIQGKFERETNLSPSDF